MTKPNAQGVHSPGKVWEFQSGKGKFKKVGETEIIVMTKGDQETLAGDSRMQEPFGGRGSAAVPAGGGNLQHSPR